MFSRDSTTTYRLMSLPFVQGPVGVPSLRSGASAITGAEDGQGKGRVCPGMEGEEQELVGRREAG